MKTGISRRQFMGDLSAISAATTLSSPGILHKVTQTKIIKPQRLKHGDTIGLITPASEVFEPSVIRQGKEVFESMGFKVKLGNNIAKRVGYLAGSDDECVADLHKMFEDDDIKAIVALRGGYGSLRILHLINYELIKKHPKIVLGYSDITALLLAIHTLTGLITFHGPVAISRFSQYTQDYFFKTLSSASAVGEIKHPEPEDKLRPTAYFRTIHEGKARGILIGGNLTLLTSLIGTSYDYDTTNKLMFIEEVGEEPYAIDRMLTQLLLAGKLQSAAGIIIDRCSKCGPGDYKPAFNNTFSVEEVIDDRLQHLKIPVVYGFSIGHVPDKPTLPLGIEATLDADNQKLIFEEAAVI